MATIIEEITVEGDARNVVHKNYMLIRGSSPEDAYEKAHELGRNSEVSYNNPAGKRVEIRFRGLNELNVIHDGLEHGAELWYEELLEVPQEQIKALLREKKSLAVFQPITPTRGPDYSSHEVVEEAKGVIGEESDVSSR